VCVCVCVCVRVCVCMSDKESVFYTCTVASQAQRGPDCLWACQLSARLNEKQTRPTLSHENISTLCTDSINKDIKGRGKYYMNKYQNTTNYANEFQTRTRQHKAGVSHGVDYYTVYDEDSHRGDSHR